MAEFTPNFNLKKPNEYEFYNIDDFNGNMDIIDNALKEAGQNEQLQIDVTEIKTDIGSPEDVNTSPTIFGKLAEIKEMLTNKFSEVVSKITGIDSKIGTSLDSGTDTVFGLLSGLNSKGAVKSVQYGNSTEGTITIAPVNPEKCMVILNNSLLSMADDSYNFVVYGTYLIGLQQTKLFIGRNYATGVSGGNYPSEGKVSWQIIEFY